MNAIEFLENEVGEVHYNPNIDNELMAELLEKYAEQRAETASAVDTIVNCTISEMKEIADYTTKSLDEIYDRNKWDGKKKITVGDVGIMLEALKKVKCN